MQMIFIREYLGFLISYFSKTLNPDKEESVLDKEVDILSLKSQDFLS